MFTIVYYVIDFYSSGSIVSGLSGLERKEDIGRNVQIRIRKEVGYKS